MLQVFKAFFLLSFLSPGQASPGVAQTGFGFGAELGVFRVELVSHFLGVVGTVALSLLLDRARQFMIGQFVPELIGQLLKGDADRARFARTLNVALIFRVVLAVVRLG